MKTAFDVLVLVNLCLLALVQLACVARLLSGVRFGRGTMRAGMTAADKAMQERSRVGQITE